MYEEDGSFMTERQINQQKTDLLRCLRDPAEEGVPSENDTKCISCLVNKPTRLCVPCGHVHLCFPCAKVLVETDHFYTVTRGDGTLLETHIKLPLTCPYCRCIIGSLPKVYLPD